MSDCPICCLGFTGTKRSKIACAYCQYEACQECYKTYITQSMQDAHCMNCRHVWTRDVLLAALPSTWINGVYKRHREKVLVEREKQLLPESQQLLANYKEANALKRENAEKSEAITRMKNQIKLMQTEIYRASWRIRRLETDEPEPANFAVKRAKPTFISPCPVENCRGFMSAEMVCGVCDAKACTKCGVLLENDELQSPEEAGPSTATVHECNKDVAANFEAIKRNTKPCPKCAVPTYKISGCNQMWCVSCHTTWDWATGDIVNGVIHNPHYFAYLRSRSATGEIPRQPGDDPNNCDRRNFPNGYLLSDRFNADIAVAFPGSFERRDNGYGRHEYVRNRDNAHIRESREYQDMIGKQNKVSRLLRYMIHISQVTMPDLRRSIARIDNKDLRVKYLANELTEKDFQVQLQRREKQREKNAAVMDIYQMATDTTRDVFWNYIQQNLTMEQTIEELDAVVQYANTHLRKLGDQYKMKIHLITFA